VAVVAVQHRSAAAEAGARDQQAVAEGEGERLLVPTHPSAWRTRTMTTAPLVH
jgi:hypothetical protein